MATSNVHATDVDELSVPRRTSVGDTTRTTADALVATLLLLLLGPVLIFIAVAIKLSGSGPVFYIQDRIGRNGQLFPFVKFRTMMPGADQYRADILGTPDEGMPERYRHDPRITPVGRYLRRWSLDELPQLINVARGEMALVGPRPILPEEIGLLDDRAEERHLCRPGLTGLWQISGRKETSWEERMELDLEYVHTQSLRTDLKIIGRTVAVVLRGDGAY